jgi:glycosyltransferase involved in cell wall biosynthesis
MKILFLVDSPRAFLGGCWFHRNHVPAKGLQSRGHEIRLYTINPDMPQEWFDWPDIAVFSRVYPIDPLPQIRKFKQMGKRVIYEIDDDLWTVNPDNPSVAISTELRWQYEHIISEASAVTTTTEYLAKKLRKFNKNVFVCPNAIDFDHYLERFKLNPRLQIGYSGAASHWKDLELIIDPLLELQGKYDFDFCLQGMVSTPLESEAYIMRQIIGLKLEPEKTRYMESCLNLYEKMRGLKYSHVPFYAPFLHAAALRRCDMDIALAPLHDNEFNKGKSCLKFYEYAAMGSATLASDVVPYNKEVGYLAKNTKKDWKNKIEKLITDEKFRKDLALKQQEWVKKNRSIDVIAPLWEHALDPSPIKK